MRILLVEDETGLANALSEHLELQGMAVDAFDHLRPAFMGLFLNQIEVEVSDLLDVLQDTKVVYSQKMRIKEEIISSLNNKLYLLTGSKDFEIVSKKSKADKRMKVYRMKQKD